MKREKYYKIFADNAREIIIGNYSIDDRYIFTNIGKEKVINDFINHEQNTLKEFIEWHKGQLDNIKEDEEELLADAVKHGYEDLAEYRRGTTDMLDRLLSHIDGKLEEFLEDNYNDK